MFVNNDGASIENLRSNTGRSIMKDLFIKEEGIFLLLLKKDIKKSIGPDKIPNEFFRRYAE